MGAAPGGNSQSAASFGTTQNTAAPPVSAGASKNPQSRGADWNSIGSGRGSLSKLSGGAGIAGDFAGGRMGQRAIVGNGNIAFKGGGRGGSRSINSKALAQARGMSKASRELGKAGAHEGAVSGATSMFTGTEVKAVLPADPGSGPAAPRDPVNNHTDISGQIRNNVPGGVKEDSGPLSVEEPKTEQSKGADPYQCVRKMGEGLSNDINGFRTHLKQECILATLGWTLIIAGIIMLCSEPTPATKAWAIKMIIAGGLALMAALYSAFECRRRAQHARQVVKDIDSTTQCGRDARTQEIGHFAMKLKSRSFDALLPGWGIKMYADTVKDMDDNSRRIDAMGNGNL